jgi:hypothetical protein
VLQTGLPLTVNGWQEEYHSNLELAFEGLKAQLESILKDAGDRQSQA